MLKKFLMLFTIFTVLCTGTAFAKSDLDNQAVIIYYSINGNTKLLAEKIHDYTGFEMYEIQTIKSYPENYKNFEQKLLSEISNKKCPKLKEKKFNDLYKYDTVFLGIPVYYGEIAPAVRTFLKHNKLAGKTVIPFYSLDNGGLGNAAKTAKKLSGKTHFKSGIEYKNKDKSMSDSEILNWLYSIK